MSEEAIKDTRQVREEERLDVDALHAYLKGVGPEFAERPALEQFPGGHSNLTYLLKWRGRELVLRRPPLGPVVKSGHDMSREVRFLRALEEAGFRAAPRVVHECADASAVGYTFYLMERKRGLVVRKTLPEEVERTPANLRRLARSVVRTLADLHGIDVVTTGIVELGRPDGYLRRQVEGWTARWQAAKTAELPEMEELAAWLAAKLPDSPAPTVVHNDYKLDNLMLGPGPDWPVEAILDWEMATVGDPLCDLGYLSQSWVGSDDPEELQAFGMAPTNIPEMPRRQELIDWYGEMSGRNVTNLRYYEAFSYFRFAVILAQIYYRYHKGQTTDPRFAVFVHALGPMAKAGLSRAHGS